MKPITITMLLTTVALFNAVNIYGQQRADSLKKKPGYEFYRVTLQVDSVTAGKVAQIQGNYKLGMTNLSAEVGLTDQFRRIRIRELVEAKNQQLRLLLSPAQQEKIIPTTEREQPKTGQK